MLAISGASTIHGPPAVINKRYCDIGQVQHVDGGCIAARKNLRIFLYDAPERPVTLENPPFIPEPSVESNILLIRLPEKQGNPVIVPPPLQHQVVYILNRQSVSSPKVIEAPAPPSTNPKVYYVYYDEGVDLQTVFNVVFQKDGTDTHEGKPSDSDFRNFDTDGLFRENLVSLHRGSSLPEYGFDELRRGYGDASSETEDFQFRHYSESDSTSANQYPYQTEVSSYSSLNSPP